VLPLSSAVLFNFSNSISDLFYHLFSIVLINALASLIDFSIEAINADTSDWVVPSSPFREAMEKVVYFPYTFSLQE
jgi:hypothetical protein